MGGSSFDDDLDVTSPSNGVVRTMVLVGRTGNGKSATGNSILGSKAFTSKASSSGVTSTCELRNTVIEDNQILNVIDTPGLFDFSDEFQISIGQEIVKCINMAKDGIHAVLIVFSVRTRFSKEEEAALDSLRTLFGNKINDCMIAVFTGGDELDEDDTTLGEYLGYECPEPLKEFLISCENRVVLFDNKTRDENKKCEQLQQLLSLVNTAMAQNGGQPYAYTGGIFTEVNEGDKKLRDQIEEVKSEIKGQMQGSYDEEQLQRIIDVIESKFREITCRLEQRLEEERSARLKAEENALAAQKKSEEEICKLREELYRTNRENEGHRNNQAQSGNCAIL